MRASFAYPSCLLVVNERIGEQRVVNESANLRVDAGLGKWSRGANAGNNRNQLVGYTSGSEGCGSHNPRGDRNNEIVQIRGGSRGMDSEDEVARVDHRKERGHLFFLGSTPLLTSPVAAASDRWLSGLHRAGLVGSWVRRGTSPFPGRATCTEGQPISRHHFPMARLARTAAAQKPYLQWRP